jgi:hypothetical protein
VQRLGDLAGAPDVILRELVSIGASAGEEPAAERRVRDQADPEFPDTLIIMAVAMTLARTLSLAVRANQTRRHPPIAPVAA